MPLSHRQCERTASYSLPTKQTSMCSLIIWNISKALEKKSCLDLRHAIRLAHSRLESETRDGISSQPPEQRHLTCALLAWQQLGHKDADSLYQFVEENYCKPVRDDSVNSSIQENLDCVNKTSISSPKNGCYSKQQYSKDVDTCSFDTISLMGPVVKLPVETKIVMRMENPCDRHSARKTKLKCQNDLNNKIDAACCMDSICIRRLADLDTAVNELRNRAGKLARREAERVELLERAEEAWKDLELGYQRRLRLAEEKEDDLEKQTKKTIEYRNNNKTDCTSFAETLKQKGEAAEKAREKIVEIEKEACEKACERLRYSEESYQNDGALAEQLCKTTQLDRDLQFKEEQARRKVWVIQNDIDSAQCLTHEAERAMRVELAALKDQIKQVSEQLLTEQTENDNRKKEVEEIRQEKADIIENLSGCKDMCDNRMQRKIDELNKKRDHLMELKQKVIDCQCKIPIDISVEAKRTPSLAALCQCTPEDKLLESCSCTSLRSQLLSNLLADLFGGLQSELSGSGSIMPCQLLKCLEEKHNWDRSSVVKTNLRNFFAQLLVGELDIAIATSIEKYHAKWVGKSCADQVRCVPEYAEDEEGWQERAIERRAQKLAAKLAEQLFKERADQLTKKAKDIMSKGPPPCQCKNQAAVFPCFVKTPISNSARKTIDTAPTYLKRTIQDVTRLRLQIEDLKKESVKKEDLLLIEEKIAKIVQRASIPDNIPPAKSAKSIKEKNEHVVKNTFPRHYIKYREQEQFIKKEIPQKLNLKQNFNSSSCQNTYLRKKCGKVYKRTEQSYAVNVCLCGPQKISNKVIKKHMRRDLKSWKSKTSGDMISKIASVKRSQPITFMPSDGCNNFPTNRFSGLCPSKDVCFHKVPSNTSIDNLLDTLIKWKRSLTNKSQLKKDNNNNYKKYSNSNLEFDNPDEERGSDKIETNLKSEVENITKCSIVGYQTSFKVDDKGTNYVNILAPTTDSVYIGEVNLDRSNDDICKCNIKQYIDKVNHGDGIDISSDDLLTCINTDTCECINIPEINNISKLNISHKLNFDKKESQLCPLELNSIQLEKFEENKSKKSIDITGDTFICDVVKHSKIFPSDCDYQVKLLGVTLTNTNEVERNQKIKENKKNVQYVNQMEMDGTKKVPEDIFQSTTYCYTQNEEINKGPFVSTDNDSLCVCCDNKNSNDLEINVFNLIEEHLKGKLAELQRKCKSTCIPRQEERKLFSSILQRVKDVISDTTNPLICKCTELNINEVSWSRAYSLLQEYIKVKIKRVQCECVPVDMDENSVLPGILERICKLIENDFQRLKDKCQCENKWKISTHKLKDVNKQTSATIKTSDIHVQAEEIQNDETFNKYMEDVSFQISSHIPLVTQSCGAMSTDIHNLSTAEKQISCELRNFHVTDCSCREQNSTPYYYNKQIFVSPFTTSNVAMSNKIDNDEFVSTKANREIIKASYVGSSSLLKDTMKYISQEFIPNPVVNEYPYYGYTLSCSCDDHLGKCYCVKSMIKTNNEKIDFMWKSLTNEKYPYIMSKIPTNIKSEPVLNRNSSNLLYINNIQLKHDVSANNCNKACVTLSNEELVLKRSKINNYTLDIRDVGNNSTDININKCDYCHWHDCSENKFYDSESYQNDAEYDKHLLYDSLYLPTNKYTKYDTSKNSAVNVDLDSEKCDCKMVPVCHVKMLVENIEKKLIQSKCTCDSLSSRICPVHSGGECFFK